MVKQEYIDQLVGVQGYIVVALHFGEGKKSGDKELVIEIERVEDRCRCRCGREFDTYYDKSLRMVRDLPYGPYKRSWLCFMQARVDCPECGGGHRTALLPRSLGHPHQEACRGSGAVLPRGTLNKGYSGAVFPQLEDGEGDRQESAHPGVAIPRRHSRTPAGG